MKLRKELLICMLCIPSYLLAYDSFSIGYGINKFQSATFYKKHVLYGLDFLHFSISSEYSETNYGQYGYTSDSSDGKMSINVFMPRLGFKMPLKHSGKVKTYNQIEGYLIVPFLSTDGEFELEREDEEKIKDALDLMGLKASHVVEYMFTDQFSLTANVGINWIIHTYNQKEEQFDNGNNSYAESSETELRTMLGMTYTKLSLNFKLDKLEEKFKLD